MKLTDWLNALPTDLDGVNVRELAKENFNHKFYPHHGTITDMEYAFCCMFFFYDKPKPPEYYYTIARKLRGMKPIDNQIKMEL